MNERKRHTVKSHRVGVDNRGRWCSGRQRGHTARRRDEVGVPVDTPVHAPADPLGDALILDLASIPAARSERRLRGSRVFTHAAEIAVRNAGGIDLAGQEGPRRCCDFAVAAHQAGYVEGLEGRLPVDAVLAYQRIRH